MTPWSRERAPGIGEEGEKGRLFVSNAMLNSVTIPPNRQLPTMNRDFLDAQTL